MNAVTSDQNFCKHEFPTELGSVSFAAERYGTKWISEFDEQW